MKIKTKKVFSALLAVLIIAASLSSCSLSQSSLSFQKNETGYALYRYKNTSTQTVFTVPDTYENEPVTELMDFSVSNSEYLKEIHIGKNIKEIGIWALTNCPTLEKIVVDEENPYFTTADGVLYTKDMTILLFYPNAKTPLVTDDKGTVTGGAEFKVPDSVKVIRSNAFYLCANLYTIEFNKGLETIGDKAFLKCGNLTKLELSDTVKTIGTDAFSYCDALAKVDIPASVTKIGDYAFFSTASSIEKIVIHQKDADALELGSNWIPQKKNSVKEKVEVEYMG